MLPIWMQIRFCSFCVDISENNSYNNKGDKYHFFGHYRSNSDIDLRIYGRKITIINQILLLKEFVFGKLLNIRTTIL